jgi:Phosphoribosyl-ATP pyrophosphohydrolase.
MDILTRIVEWNKERNLLALGFDHTKEASFIIEEVLESSGQYDSETARQRALETASSMVGSATASPEQIVDAWADIIVFATGGIAKAGYDPASVMEEVYKEISSRTGTLVDGKFIKDKDVVPYKANLSRCKLSSQ